MVTIVRACVQGVAHALHVGCNVSPLTLHHITLDSNKHVNSCALVSVYSHAIVQSPHNDSVLGIFASRHAAIEHPSEMEINKSADVRREREGKGERGERREERERGGEGERGGERGREEGRGERGEGRGESLVLLYLV